MVVEKLVNRCTGSIISLRILYLLLYNFHSLTYCIIIIYSAQILSSGKI